MSGAGSEFRRYYRAVVGRLWIVLLLAGLGAAGVAGYLIRQPRHYMASATLIVSDTITQPVISPTGSGSASNIQSRTQSSVVANDVLQFLSSRPVAEATARAIGLKDPREVMQQVSAAKITNTDLITVKAVSREREMASLLANATSEQTIAYFHEVNRRDSRAVREFIERELTKSRARLNALDASTAAYKVQHGFADLTAEISDASRNAAKAREDYDATVLQLREDEAKLAAAGARLANEKVMRVVSGTLKDNPVYQQLQSRLTTLEIQSATISQIYTPRHPKVKQLEGEIANVKQQMSAVARKIIDNEVSQVNPAHDHLLQDTLTAEVGRAAVHARLDALAFLERRLDAKLVTYPPLDSELNQMTRERRILDTNYSTLSGRYLDALLRENEAGYAPAAVEIVQPAVAPQGPVPLQVPLKAGIGALVGLLVGLMLAIFGETSDDRIRTSRDAERTFGVPVLAEVPSMERSRAFSPASVGVGVMLLIAVVGGGALGSFIRAKGVLPINRAPLTSEYVLALATRGVSSVMSWTDNVRATVRVP